MRSAILVVFAFVWSMPLVAQGTDDKLRSKIEALHAKWFKAFDSGDGATMDRIEMENLSCDAGRDAICEDYGKGGQATQA